MPTYKPAEVPAWPVYAFDVQHSGRVSVSGPLLPASEHPTRGSAIDAVAAAAVGLGRPVRATATEPDGTVWQLVISPDGSVDELAGRPQRGKSSKKRGAAGRGAGRGRAAARAGGAAAPDASGAPGVGAPAVGGAPGAGAPGAGAPGVGMAPNAVGVPGAGEAPAGGTAPDAGAVPGAGMAQDVGAAAGANGDRGPAGAQHLAAGTQPWAASPAAAAPAVSPAQAPAPETAPAPAPVPTPGQTQVPVPDPALAQAVAPEQLSAPAPDPALVSAWAQAQAPIEPQPQAPARAQTAVQAQPPAQAQPQMPVQAQAPAHTQSQTQPRAPVQAQPPAQVQPQAAAPAPQVQGQVSAPAAQAAAAAVPGGAAGRTAASRQSTGAGQTTPEALNMAMTHLDAHIAAGRMEQAVTLSAQLDEHAAGTFGLSHPDALRVREAHAHVTALAGDPVGGIRLYRDVAERWLYQGGGQEAEAVADRAHALWLEIPDLETAVAAGVAMVRMRNQIPGADGSAFAAVLEYQTQLETAARNAAGQAGVSASA